MKNTQIPEEKNPNSVPDPSGGNSPENDVPTPPDDPSSPPMYTAGDR